MENKYLHLKSGSDIRGVACNGIDGEKIELTNETVFNLTIGFCKWLQENNLFGNKKIAVGHDSRITALTINEQVVKALAEFDCEIYYCSYASTPAMFMTTVDLNCSASIQITASHHPFNKNGLKFFIPTGGLSSKDILRITELASEDFETADKDANVIEYDFMSVYAKRLRDMICREINADYYEKPLSGYKIIVDAGNGVGGFYANDVLAVLGADTTGSQFLEKDGMFPNHIPNPENKVAMAAITQATVKNGADLGIIFDTDVDRAGCVDKNGNEINRNRLVALASLIALEGNDGGIIVTDSVTSTGLTDFINNKLHGQHYRFKRGYKNVIDEQIRLQNEGHNCPLAIETSGHAAFSENFYLDDGAYLITKIVIKMAQLGKKGKELDSLLVDLKDPEEETELRFKILADDFKSYGNSVISELEKYAEKQENWRIADDNREGIRIYFDSENAKGWLLLRLSVHDPIMPLNIESDVKGGVKVIAEEFLCFIATCDKLDITPLKAFLKE